MDHAIRQNPPRSPSTAPQAASSTNSGRRKKTFSFRLEPDLYARLDRRRQEQGISFADMMRQYLGVVEVSDQTAYDRGRREAREEFGVLVPCFHCDEPFIVRHADLKKEIADLVVDLQRWCHADCSREHRGQ